jgi:molecular chaperone DnaK (HSP70)
VGGSSRIPLIRRWLIERCPGVPLRDERPIEAVALGALALTPGLRVKDVLSRGVSLRCWDRRSHEHRWHPLFLAGQSWPTARPLELMLACRREGQSELELVLGEPRLDDRCEVIFVEGMPQLRSRPAGAATVEPWGGAPPAVPLNPPGQRGVDRLRLWFGIDGHGQLLLESEDLLTGVLYPARPLGPVR